jgi:ParB family transcriptional regulator, chromosome partitioning protein
MTLRLSDAIRSLKGTQFDQNEPPASPSFEISALNAASKQSMTAIAHSTQAILKLADIVVGDRLRQYLDAEKTASLAHSIRQYGFRGVLWVRPVKGSYHLIAGGRRYAACQLAGVIEVPVEIWEVTDAEAIQLELLENFQREDLNPIEEAEGVMRMLEVTLELERSEVIALLNRKARQERNSSADNVVRAEKNAQNHGIKPDQFVEADQHYQQVEDVFNLIGKYTPESFRTHRLPLLNLPQPVIAAISTGQLEYTKARLIARIKDEDIRSNVLAEVIQSGLSHAEVDGIVRQVLTKPDSSQARSEQQQFQSRATALVRRLKSAKLESKARKKAERLMTQLEELLSSSEQN